MYDRRVNGTELTFGHSGILYKWSFVLYDRQTESLWVHASGRAEHGPMKGRQLRLVPSMVTSWAKWKEAYPSTKVLSGERGGYFFGTFHGFTGARHNLGLVVIVRFKGKLFPYRDLAYQTVVNDSFNGPDFAVFYSPDEGSATAWSRRLDKRLLTFEAGAGKKSQGATLIYDRQTGTIWHSVTGKALEGPLQGRKLKRMQSNPILNSRFKGFYPDGPVFRSPARRVEEELEFESGKVMDH